MATSISMTAKLSNILKDVFFEDKVASGLSDYRQRYVGKERKGLDERKRDYKNFVNIYYNLVTDFYEYGWGQSFHFAPRSPNESFAASLARHEHYMAHMLSLRPGMLALDLGCGVGGPLREIARYSGAGIVGVNNNAYQLERARKHTEDTGLNHLAEYLKCDYMQIDAPDNSFDAVYGIEATCHAPDKAGVYGEVFRLLKPGACFGNYEYCLTDLYDEQDPKHHRIKTDIEVDSGLPDIPYQHQVDHALREVGYEVLETRDLALQSGPGIPWYQPLIGSGCSLASFRSTRLGRRVTHSFLRVLEALKIVPRGTIHVSKMLDSSASALAEAGQLGIFTPMYFQLARKPE